MGYTIKEVSEKFGVTAHTLRYYEKEGLIPSVRREKNGRREYSDTDLEWLNIVCCMRATGMSIEHIKQYIALCLLGDDTIPQRRKIILCQKEILEKHISEYKKLLSVVNKKLRRYDELEQCERAPQPETQKASL